MSCFYLMVFFLVRFKVLERQKVCLPCSMLFSLATCETHSRQSVNICWMNKSIQILIPFVKESNALWGTNLLIFKTSFSSRANELYFLWLKRDIFFPIRIIGKKEMYSLNGSHLQNNKKLLHVTDPIESLELI